MEADHQDHHTVNGVVDCKGRRVTRSHSGRWRSAYFIIGVGVAEWFAYYGISSNLISYLTGPFGQSASTAAENVNTWSGAGALLRLLGAFVADSYLGRYRTIVCSSLLYILGLGLLTLSAVLLPYLSSSDCQSTPKITPCSPPHQLQLIFFFSLYLIALGQGAHKPCLLAFGADQFDGEDPEESKAKSSFFNWWYLGLCGGPLTAVAAVNYIQDNLNWGLGFGIPCISMVFALVIFLLGIKTYRYIPLETLRKRPFSRIGQVFAKAARNWRTAPSEMTIEEEAQETLLPRQGSHQFKFLNKALLASNGEVCSIGEVEEAKAVLRLFPIWGTCLPYAIVNAQSSTFFTEQGISVDRTIGSNFDIPAASLQYLIGLSILAFIPIYDRIFIPLAKAITRKPSGITTLQRIGLGMMLSVISMVIAALVERKRLETAIEYGLSDMPKSKVPLSFWWLVPQYLLLGISDVFIVVGLQEFFYDQAPGELKSVGLSLYLSIFGVGSFLSSFLISFIEKVTGRGHGGGGWFPDNLNRAHLDYFYWLLAGLSAVALLAYVCFVKSYFYNRGSTI